MWPNCICLRCVILKCTFQKKKKKNGGKKGLSKSQLNRCTAKSIYKPYLSWFCIWTNCTFRPYPKTNTWQQQSEAIAFSQGCLSACSSCAIFLASGSSISSTSAHKHASLYSAFHSVCKIRQRNANLSPELCERTYNAAVCGGDCRREPRASANKEFIRSSEFSADNVPSFKST